MTTTVMPPFPPSGAGICGGGLHCFSPSAAWSFAAPDAASIQVDVPMDASIDQESVPMDASIDQESADGEGGTGTSCPDLRSQKANFVCSSWFTSLPVWMNGQCCYEQTTCPCSGRPFVVEGQSRAAEAQKRGDWCSPEPGKYVGNREQRRRLALAWLSDGLIEHASIASFARVTLQLLALGAPPDLIARTQRASLDEIEHAKLCFSLASRHAGEDLGPGALSMSGSMEPTDLVDFADATVREGCVNETLAALIAGERARLARDPEAKSALLRIAADEARHAALAWCTLQWAIAQGGSTVGEAAATAFAEELAKIQASSEVTSEATLDEELAREHGLISPRAQRELCRVGAAEIVASCAVAIGLGSSREFRAHHRRVEIQRADRSEAT